MVPTEHLMDGYIRVSVVGGRSGDRFQSPIEQRETIQRWADANGVTIAEWHEDLDKSGGTMDRPGMNLALERVRAGRTGGIVVARLDRFARTVSGGLTTIDELHERGARVVSVAEAIDPATPVGRAMLGLLLIMAAWFRDQAKEHLNASMDRAVSAGRFPGRAAYGYARDEDGLTYVDEEAATVVRRIFRERIAGKGWREIARRLDLDGIPTAAGRDVWNPSSVYRIVKSEAPKGVFVGPNGLRIEGAFPPLVTDEEWVLANRVKGARDNEPRHHDRLVAGVARCSGCRFVLSRTVNTEGYVSYGCTRRGCTGRASIGAPLLDEIVRARIDERFGQERVEAQAAADDGEGIRLRTALVAARKELDEWVADLEIRGALGDTAWRQGMLARAGAVDDAETGLAQHEARQGVRMIGAAPGAEAFRIERLSWERQREVVRAALHSVWVRRSSMRGPQARRHAGERVRVVWADDPSRPVLPSHHGPPVGPLAW